MQASLNPMSFRIASAEAKEKIDLIRQYREESGIHSGLLSLYNDIIFNVHNMHHMTAVFEP